MKKCKNCKKDFNEKQKTEKYCSTECSYKAIDEKRYARNKTCSLVKCIACDGKGVVKRRVYSILSDEQKKKILSLYRDGYGIREIQREVGAKHPYTVSYYIRTCNQ